MRMFVWTSQPKRISFSMHLIWACGVLVLGFMPQSMLLHAKSMPLKSVTYQKIKNNKGVSLEKPIGTVIAHIKQPNIAYPARKPYRLIAKCDTLRVWIPPNSPTPTVKHLEDFCWHYDVHDANGATPNRISTVVSAPVDVVFTELNNDNTAGVGGQYTEENQTVWIQCKEKEHCMDTKKKRAVVSTVLFHELHHLRQDILLCGKNKEDRCYAEFYRYFTGLLEGGAGYEQYRRSERNDVAIVNTGIPDENPNCVSAFSRGDYECATFVLAKLHQLYELNKKPDVASETYMEIFILKKLMKTRSFVLGDVIAQIFRENTTLSYPVKLPVIEGKVNVAMVEIIKSGNKNRKKIAQDICKHPDLPNYQPYLPYCPKKR